MINRPRSIGKWEIECKLGEGAFGSVFLVSVTSKAGQRRYAAMKVEGRKQNKFDELLRMEVYVLQKLQVPNGENQKFFCTIHDQGQTEQYNYIVITLLKRPLDDWRRLQNGRRFSAVTTLKIGIQLMAAFKRMHRAGFIHRDVKPANMAPGHKRASMIYLFDFGLARFIYTDETKKKLRERRARTNFRGTHRYCSYNAHRGCDQGRIDDIWSVLYCLVEFCKSKLPWAGLSTKEKEKMKGSITDDELFKDCPPSFKRISQALRPLGFADKPGYVQYENWMNEDLRELGVNLLANGANVPFEWEQQMGEKNSDETTSYEKMRHAVRERSTDYDDDSIRTADTIFSTTSQTSTNKASGEETIDDTLDDLPDNDKLLQNKEKRAKAVAATTKNGKADV